MLISKTQEIEVQLIIAQIYTLKEIEKEFSVAGKETIIDLGLEPFIEKMQGKNVILLNMSFILEPKFKISIVRPLGKLAIAYIPDLKLKVGAGSLFYNNFKKERLPKSIIKKYSLKKNIYMLQKNSKYLKRQYAGDILTQRKDIQSNYDILIPFEIMKFDISTQDLEDQKLKILQNNITPSEKSLKSFL